MHGFEPVPIDTINELRQEYELGGVSFETLSRKYRVLVSELTKFAEENNWEQIQPNALDTEAVNQFYSTVRQRLTVEMAQRAIAIWNNIKYIEDEIIKDILEKIAFKNETENPVHFLSSNDLIRFNKILDSIKASNKLYSEAVVVPSIKDRDLKVLFKNLDFTGLKTITEYLQTRGIPIPD
jgi:hypothetical protein